jgi:hypothetical protein
MCVIFFVDEERPYAGQIEAAFNQNPQGAGIAWREGGKVHWRKGLELEEIKEECAYRPIPYVAHFRVASMNQQQLDYLCHPFPLTDDVETDLEGSTDGYVLFHNGSWTSWKHDLREAIFKSGKKLPPDPWIDTRAMAWVAHHFGLGMLELIDQKIFIISPTNYNGFGDEWYKIPVGSEGKTFWASNKLWMNHHGNKTGHWSHGWGKTREETDDYYKRRIASLPGGQAGGPDPDMSPFRGEDKTAEGVQGAQDQQKAVPEGHEEGASTGGTADSEGEEDPGAVLSALESDDAEALLWACSINQYPISKKPKIRYPVRPQDDAEDRAKRETLRARGIEMVGPL